MTIFQHLTLGYLTILLMVLLFGGYMAFQLNRLNHITHLASGVDSEAVQTAESLSTKLLVVVSLEKKFWISGDAGYLSLFRKRGSEFIEDLMALDLLLSDGETKASIRDAAASAHSYVKQVESLAELRRTPLPAAYEAGREEMVRRLSVYFKQIISAFNKVRHERIQQSESISASLFRMALALAAVCICTGLGVSLLITGRIVRPIEVLRRQTREISAGRFVTISDIHAPPEISDLAEDFNLMSERLKELDSMKEDFVNRVSHTLRTPLTAIWEASVMLDNGSFEETPENRSQLLTIVRDECKRLISSVNRILDLSRMEGGMMAYDFVKCDLNEIIQSDVFKLGPVAKSKRITLNFIPCPEPPMVMADTEQIHQLLENLIGNAMKFSDADGNVTVEAAVPGGAGNDIRVSIADTGCGIDPGHLETIFDKFHRLDERNGAPKGTGLGLSIARHIVAAHGGDIWVESKKGSGSTFYFSLPRA